ASAAHCPPRTGESPAASGAARARAARARERPATTGGPHPAPRRGCAGRTGIRSGSQPDAHSHTCAGRACRSSPEQRFPRPHWPDGITTRPAGTGLTHARVAAGSARRANNCTHDGPRTGTGGGWQRIEGRRGGGGAVDGTNPGDRAPPGDIPRGPSACARYAYWRAATLTDEYLRQVGCIVAEVRL